jgi:hypothetical protein
VWRDHHHVRQAEQAKAKIITELGGRCICCGETELDFLTIREVRGKYRSEFRNWMSFEAGRQQGLFYVICYNCNVATRYGAVCPHKWKRRGG